MCARAPAGPERTHDERHPKSGNGFLRSPRTWVGVDLNVHQTNLTLKNYFGNQEDIVFADVLPVFCNADGCLTRIGDDRQTGITSWDYGHLTPVASDYLARHLLVESITQRIEGHSLPYKH